MTPQRLEEIRERAELSRKRDWVVPREAIADIDGLLEHVEELQALAERGARYRWVPVAERLPDIDYTKAPYYRYVKTIARGKNGDCGELWYRSNGYAKTEKGRIPRWELPNGRKYDEKVTHWMPIPEPEEEEL